MMASHISTSETTLSIKVLLGEKQIFFPQNEKYKCETLLWDSFGSISALNTNVLNSQSVLTYFKTPFSFITRLKMETQINLLSLGKLKFGLAGFFCGFFMFSTAEQKGFRIATSDHIFCLV